ncbi:hypothetical protein D1007_34331 [Hordeum vulgare]|nr:hypothetical protein D1007_34331 [Hordeum vulgare]
MRFQQLVSEPVRLDVVCRAGGVPAMTAFVGGCTMELRAVCRPVEVRGDGGRRLWRRCVVAQPSRRRGEKAVEVLRDGAEAAVERRPSSWTRRIGRVDRVSA